MRIALGQLKSQPRDRRAALLAARCLTRLGFHGPAEEHFRAAGHLASGLDDLQDRAFGLVQNGRPERAAELYRDILARWPDDILALKRLSAAYMSLKQWKRVLDVADRLIAVQGGEVSGQTLAGIAHHELKHYDQAVAAGDRVLALDPELKEMPLPHGLFWNNLALDLMAVGRTSERGTISFERSRNQVTRA